MVTTSCLTVLDANRRITASSVKRDSKSLYVLRDHRKLLNVVRTAEFLFLVARAGISSRRAVKHRKHDNLGVGNRRK